MKQRRKEHDVTFLPKGGSKKRERNKEEGMSEKSRRQTPQTPESEKGRRPVWIIKPQISQQASHALHESEKTIVPTPTNQPMTRRERKTNSTKLEIAGKRK